MENLKFTKMVGAGNDFVVIGESLKKGRGIRNYSKIARSLCRRKTGIGGDGLLVLERSEKADFRMRIFNADGTEAEMCGNGLRCAALFAHGLRKNVSIETKAGVYAAEIIGKNKVKIKMENPKDFTADLPIKVNNRSIKVNYIDTGVPHVVIFVRGIDKIDVESIGRSVRNNKKFRPRGANVDFVEVIDDKNIKMRTYERGVEAETLACGTGAAAAAMVTSHASQSGCRRINVHTRGGILRVYFDKSSSKGRFIYLEGDAKEVYRGEVKYV